MKSLIEIYADGIPPYPNYINKIIDKYSIRGFTCNPTLIKNYLPVSYYDYCKIILNNSRGFPVSIQVLASDPKEMIKEARMISSCAENVYVISFQLYDYLRPTEICVFYHGDLTYENILVDNGNIKLIDFDNDNLAGCPELDLGKLMQSVLTQYEFWDSLTDEQVFNYEFNKIEYDTIINFYSKLLKQSIEQIRDKAYFYCALHLFRMIPYQAKTGVRRANLALTLCNKFISKIS